MKMESERDENKVSKGSAWKGERNTLGLSQLSTSVIPAKTHPTYPIIPLLGRKRSGLLSGAVSLRRRHIFTKSTIQRKEIP
jgi:hypothetical protein